MIYTGNEKYNAEVSCERDTVWGNEDRLGVKAGETERERWVSGEGVHKGGERQVNRFLTEM